MNKIIYAGLLIGLLSTSTEGFAANVAAVDPTIAQSLQTEASTYLGMFQQLNTDMGSFESTTGLNDYGYQYDAYVTSDNSLQTGISNCLQNTGSCLQPISNYPNVEVLLNNANQDLATAVEMYNNLPVAGSPTVTGSLQANIAQFQALAKTIEAQLTAIQNNIVPYSQYYNSGAQKYGVALGCTSNDCPPTTPGSSVGATKSSKGAAAGTATKK